MYVFRGKQKRDIRPTVRLVSVSYVHWNDRGDLFRTCLSDGARWFYSEVITSLKRSGENERRNATTDNLMNVSGVYADNNRNVGFD